MPQYDERAKVERWYESMWFIIILCFHGGRPLADINLMHYLVSLRESNSLLYFAGKS